MSITLRQCVINCLPKGNKPRHLLNNWRPISLLPVIYKIGSSAIANRLKKVLDKKYRKISLDLYLAIILETVLDLYMT